MARYARIALFYVLMALQAFGDSPPRPTPSATCSKALKACIELTKAQDKRIAELKKDREDLADDLAKAETPPTVPTWAWLSIGILGSLVIGPVGALAVTVTGSQVLK